MLSSPWIRLLLALTVLPVGVASGSRSDTSLSGPRALEGPKTDPGSARATPVRRPVRRLLELAEPSCVADHLRHLSEEIGPRLTSSSNLARAERWALDTFTSFGLDAHLEKWGDMPVGFDRGPSSGGMVSPELVSYAFTTMAWSPGTDGPVRGAALPYPESREALHALAPRLPGAWIVVPERERLSRLGWSLRNHVDRALERAELAGMIAPTRAYDGRLLHILGDHRQRWDALPTRVRIHLTRADHADLAARVRRGEEIELEFDVGNRFVEGPIPQHNVVAEIRGTEFPSEVVVFAAHLDSWDLGTGAVDNATGVATTIEAARLLSEAGVRPRRTIRFILFGGEEQGLLGSRRYVDQHADELERISAVFVHDGGTNYISGIDATPEMRDDLRSVFDPVAGWKSEMPFEVGVVDGLLNSGSSDHAPFLEAGVPAFFWRQSGRSDYDHCHHTQHDTVDFVIPEYQEHSATVVAVAAIQLANLDSLLDRTRMEPLPNRRLGVALEGTRVTRVFPNTQAHLAGIAPGDSILAVDGEPTFMRREILRLLQLGGPEKRIRTQRRDELIDVRLDFTGEPGERERASRRRARQGLDSSL